MISYKVSRKRARILEAPTKQKTGGEEAEASGVLQARQIKEGLWSRKHFRKANLPSHRTSRVGLCAGPRDTYLLIFLCHYP